MRYWAASFTLTACLAQSGAQQTYRDPQNRFVFSYPAEFGAPSAGTNNGAGDRLVAIRFSEFSAGVRGGAIVLGGEAVLTRGFPFLDIQAAGGLYDEITLEVFPDPMRAVVLRSLPRLTVSNFCAEIARERHVDPASAAFQSFNAPQKQALANVDRMRNVAPKIVRCDVTRDTVRFDKEVAFEAGGPRQHVYGAVRFLPEPYSTFQLIRGGANPPPGAVLDQIAEVVRSWRVP